MKSFAKFLIVAVMSFFLGWGSNYITTRQVIKDYQSSIKIAIEKHTNQIVNEFDKIKVNRNGKIDLEVSSYLSDTTKRKGFFKKIFGRD